MPSRVAGSFGPVWLRIPSRVSTVRFRPRPSRSRSSTTRSDCSLWRKRRPKRSGEHLVEGLLAGVAERRVAEVVAERDRLGQVLVQPQRPGDGARDPGGLERVREPRAVVVALRVDEDLGLVLEAPERLAVDDAVAVALERRPAAGTPLPPHAHARASRRSARRAGRATSPPARECGSRTRQRLVRLGPARSYAR